MLDAETKHGKRLVQLGFMRRFDAQYQAMKETIVSGQIGAPLIFQSGHRNPSVPAYYTANNALTDTAVHDIDIARYLLDDEPVAISVKAPRKKQPRRRPRRSVADPDRDAAGALVVIETSVNIAYAYDIRGEVIGETGVVTLAERNDIVVRSNGALEQPCARGLARAVCPGLRRRIPRMAQRRRQRRGRRPEFQWDGYVATVAANAGVRAIETGQREPVNFADGRRCMWLRG